MKTWILTGLLIFSALGLRAQSQTTADDSALTNTLDMVEVIKNPVVFTNSAGMILVPTAGYWTCRYEVRQAEYQSVMKGNPSQYVFTNNPVDNVSWNNAMDFCQKLTLLERKKSNLPENYQYTLPTDAQWETLVGDAQLTDAITSEGHVGGSRTHPEAVGTLKPNSFGLYDMRGNVMEFQLDRADPNQPYRVLRGGAYDTWFEVNLRTAFRNYAASPDEAKPDYGFRCILIQTAPAPMPAK